MEFVFARTDEYMTIPVGRRRIDAAACRKNLYGTFLQVVGGQHLNPAVLPGNDREVASARKRDEDWTAAAQVEIARVHRGLIRRSKQAANSETVSIQMEFQQAVAVVAAAGGCIEGT